jgi:hypothetical protein
MAQDYGPAQPIFDVLKSGYEKLEKLTGDPGATNKKVDPTWHNDMVNKANESFKPTPKPAPKKAARKPARKR